jgi:hypothetical protein
MTQQLTLELSAAAPPARLVRLLGLLALLGDGETLRLRSTHATDWLYAVLEDKGFEYERLPDRRGQRVVLIRRRR